MEEGKEEGYVKLWRRTLKSDVWQNPKVWRIWCWMLMKATHKQINQMVGYQSVTLNPGEFIFGRKICSKETMVSEKSVRRCLQSLKSANRVAIKSSNKFSIVSIINWSEYQDDEVISENKKGQQKGQQGASKGPARGHKQSHRTHKELERESTSVDSLGEIGPQAIPKTPPCPVEKIIELYHQHLPASPRVQILSEASRKSVVGRWRENQERQNLEWWADLFKEMAMSDFLSGRAGKWLVYFTWIFKPENFSKILNGAYKNRSKGGISEMPARTRSNLRAVSAVEKLIEEGKV